MPQANFQILETAGTGNILAEFQVLSDPVRTVEWGLSVREFRKKYPDVLESDGRFRFPIRVGDLRIDSGIIYSKNQLEGFLTGFETGKRMLKVLSDSCRGWLNEFRVDVKGSDGLYILEADRVQLTLNYYGPPPEGSYNPDNDTVDKIQFTLKVFANSNARSLNTERQEEKSHHGAENTNRYRSEFGY